MAMRYAKRIGKEVGETLRVVLERRIHLNKNGAFSS